MQIEYLRRRGDGRNAGFIKSYDLLPLGTIRARGYDQIHRRNATPKEVESFGASKRVIITTFKTLEDLLETEKQILSETEFAAVKKILVRQLPPSSWAEYGEREMFVSWMASHGYDVEKLEAESYEQSIKSSSSSTVLGKSNRRKRTSVEQNRS